MKNKYLVPIAIALVMALVAVNVRLLAYAQTYTCTTVNCGAGEFTDGGIDSSLTCETGACWWNSCSAWPRGCPSGGYSRQCSQTGPLGCPNTPCNDRGAACSADADCCTPYICLQDLGTCETNTPIMINLKNNSSHYDLTSYIDGVLFDIHATGAPLQVGWTEPDSLIGILVLDRNGNGTIDDGSELFGTATRKRDGRRAVNGFDALVDLDGGPGVSDGRIDSNDPWYTLLRVWFDDNHDGVSQANELVPLADAGVSALFTAYQETPRMDRHGNLYKYEGSALVVKNGREYKHKLFDVALIVPAMVQ